MKRVDFILSIVILSLAILTSTTYALRLPKSTLKNLIIDSPIVLIGTVVGQHYHYYGKDKFPYTVYSLHLQDVVYGKDQLPKDFERDIQLPVFGGLNTKGKMTTVTGTTKLAMGSTYLLFLRGGKWTHNPISGWNQGAFHLISAGSDIGRIVLSLDGKVLMGIKDDRLIFQISDFSHIRSTDQCLPPKKGSGIKLTRDIQPKQKKPLSDEEELSAERKRLKKLEWREVKLEEAPKINPRKQLDACLGGQPMFMNEFVEVIQKLRSKLANQIPDDMRSFSFEPVVPSGRGMAPPDFPENEPLKQQY